MQLLGGYVIAMQYIFKKSAKGPNMDGLPLRNYTDDLFKHNKICGKIKIGMFIVRPGS